MNRRDYLRAVGLGGAAVIAGCGSSGTSGDSSPDSTPNPETTPTDTPEPTDTSTPIPEPASFRVQDVSAPESVQLNERFEIAVTVENTGGQSGVWESELEWQVTAGPDPDTWELVLPELEIPPGETFKWTSGRFSLSRPSVFYYRLSDRPTQTVDIPGTRAPIIDATNLVSEWSS